MNELNEKDLAKIIKTKVNLNDKEINEIIKKSNFIKEGANNIEKLIEKYQKEEYVSQIS